MIKVEFFLEVVVYFVGIKTKTDELTSCVAIIILAFALTKFTSHHGRRGSVGRAY